MDYRVITCNFIQLLHGIIEKSYHSEIYDFDPKLFEINTDKEAPMKRKKIFR